MAKARSVIPKVHFTLPQVASFAFVVPTPPSTNHLYANVKHGRIRSAKAQDWYTHAGRELTAQGGAKAVRGPVTLSLSVPEKDGRDLDNHAKILIDFAVHHGIIENDDNAIVREIHLGWTDETAAIVEVRKAYDWIVRRDLKAREAA